MAVDLHLHSTASDGTLSPGELVQLAHRLDLSAIAITDHDSVEGVEAGLGAARSVPLEVVPAVELSSDLDGRDIHFLGYFVDHRDETFRRHLGGLRGARYARAYKMVKRLQEAGLDIAFRDVLEVAGGGAVGRSHLAAVMVKKGYIDSIQEAFDRYIGRKAPAYVEKYHYEPGTVIDMIRGVGGIAVLAHPGLSQVDEMIPWFVEQGIQGIEVYHSEHTGRQARSYLRLAKRLNLAVTGGSDCHGLEQRRGLKIGSLSVPDWTLEGLRGLKLGAEGGAGRRAGAIDV